MIDEALATAEPLLVPIVVLAGSVALGLLFALLVVRVVAGLTRGGLAPLRGTIRRRLRLPSLFLFPSIFCAIGLSFAGLPEDAGYVVAQIVRVAIMLSIAWMVLRALTLGEDLLLSRYRVDVSDNLRARKVHTQILYLRRIASFTVVVVASGAVLLTFEEIQQIGTTILTTAGVAGVIVGFAAQKSLATMIAGLQIAFTQPIRLDDAVIVEGEWGWVEEITLTYVVVKLWDWRRLVVPINHFLENVFQNWTR
ncbi:MAG: mechanosensitive ion channel family protein, partial [Spirochaetota bacterium]